MDASKPWDPRAGTISGRTTLECNVCRKGHKGHKVWAAAGGRHACVEHFRIEAIVTPGLGVVSQIGTRVFYFDLGRWSARKARRSAATSAGMD
jgi:hypothetical protein